jgi:hypothetical protein
MPAPPLYRLRFSPCRRVTTLIRPSEPVRHFCPLRNQRLAKLGKPLTLYAATGCHQDSLETRDRFL